jgi:hypothetical protein
MEASSPLAAMQPQPIPFGHGHWNLDNTSGRLGALGSGNFNFKDLSMRNNHSDYFNLRPSRSASPTACLAVDLSRNFHIDKRFGTIGSIQRIRLMYFFIVLNLQPLVDLFLVATFLAT